MMQVKRYVAASFAEALIQAKNELGTDAMIVESKKLKVGGMFGLFRRELTELTVAVDAPAPLAGRPAATPQPARPLAAAAPGNLSALEREVADLRVAISRLLERSDTPAARTGDARAALEGFGRQAYAELVERGVEEAVALEIGQRVGADEQAGITLFQQEMLRCLGRISPIETLPGSRKIVAMVGPTGVGKTTTLAKLAAHFSLEQELQVGLITADTYRIAAIEQLRTYADILGIPVYTADTSEQVTQALRETAACDLVLVDTAGRNHKDAERMGELRKLLDLLRPDETHLVVSLTSNPKDAFSALETYLPLGVNRLTFTKLDEASAPGQILNICRRASQPVSYITHGQSVPEDLLPANRVDYAKLLLGVAAHA